MNEFALKNQEKKLVPDLVNHNCEAINTKNRMTNDALEALRKSLEQKYPLGVPRPELSKATGGVLHPRTQANRDCMGCGISERYKNGKIIIYTISGVLKHIQQRMA